MNASTCTVEVWVMVRVTIGFPRFLHHTSSTLPHAWFGLGSALGLGLLIAWCGAKTEETPPAVGLGSGLEICLGLGLTLGSGLGFMLCGTKKETYTFLI